jgi:hypothetical protein
MVHVAGQREITALELVATQRPNSTDARGRTVRHPVQNAEVDMSRSLSERGQTEFADTEPGLCPIPATPFLPAPCAAQRDAARRGLRWARPCASGRG